jgi:hypothetical protein
MASVQTCVTKSVTLQPGEPFNLPAGAEIIAVTDINSLSSTCPLPSDLEELECYIAIFIAQDVDGNRPPYQGGDTNEQTFYLRGMVVNGTYYDLNLVPSSPGVFPVNSITSFINNNSNLNSILLSTGTGQAVEANEGAAATICFKTVPSIAQSMYFLLQTYVVGLGPAFEPETTFRIYPEKRTDYISRAGGTPPGTCTCAS